MVDLQEAVIREQVLETKLGTLQRIVGATREAAELGWTALMEEDRLLTRIESLENQLIICSKVRAINLATSSKVLIHVSSPRTLTKINYVKRSESSMTKRTFIKTLPRNPFVKF